MEHATFRFNRLPYKVRYISTHVVGSSTLIRVGREYWLGVGVGWEED